MSEAETDGGFQKFMSETLTKNPEIKVGPTIGLIKTQINKLRRLNEGIPNIENRFSLTDYVSYSNKLEKLDANLRLVDAMKTLSEAEKTDVTDESGVDVKIDEPVAKKMVGYFRSDVKEMKLEGLVNVAVGLDDSFWKTLKKEIDYAGFNRELLLDSVRKLPIDETQLVQTVATITFRGPKKASTMKLSFLDGKTYKDIGIHTGTAGKDDPTKITANRLISLFPDLAAIGLKRMNAPKRIPTNLLPGFLQFPSAASLPLPVNMAAWHRKFAEEFSALIKGKFSEDIYNSIAGNKIVLDPATVKLLGLEQDLTPIPPKASN